MIEKTVIMLIDGNNSVVLNLNEKVYALTSFY